ncbi:MAG: hypothetical protein ACYS47_08615, partial [Planctomycetota bacterium]
MGEPLLNWKGGILGLVLLAVAAVPDEADGKGGSPDKFIVSARLRWWVPQVQGSFQINQKDYRGS